MSGRRRSAGSGWPLGQVLLALVDPAAVLLDGVGVAEARRPSPSPFPRRLWPENPTLENYVTAFRPEFRVYFMNSMIVSLSTVVITVSLALLAAYTFTRTQTRLILILHERWSIAAQMFPASAIIIPIYKLMKDADLLNTYASLILAYITVTLPVAIWMLRAFMARLPVELDEAAAIDGCGPLRTFFVDHPAALPAGHRRDRGVRADRHLAGVPLRAVLHLDQGDAHAAGRA